MTKNELYKIKNILEVYHSRIKEICLKLPGDKTLIFNQEVSKILNKICDMTLLKSGGIKNIFKFPEVSYEKSLDKVIFLVTSESDSIDDVVNFINSGQDKKKYVIGFVPFLSESGRYFLNKRVNALENVGLFDLKIGWIPLDVDLMTLNCPYLYPSSFLNQNSTWSYFLGEMLAEAILIGLERPTFNCKFFALGEQSNLCFQGLHAECQRSAKATDNKLKDKSGVTNVFILSRDLDYITPFCLPITFEALIHEVIGFDLDTITLTSEMTNEKNDKVEKLNSTNSVFQATRDKALALVGVEIVQRNKKWGDVTSQIDVMKRPDELKKFMTEDMKDAIRMKNEISTCFQAYGYILNQTTLKDRVDDIMKAQASLLLASEEWEFPKHVITEFLTCRHETKQLEALRLLCLWTTTHDGIPNNIYREMYRLVCHSLGYPIISLLNNLKKLKLFAPKSEFQTHSNTNSNDVISMALSSNQSVFAPQHSSSYSANLNMIKNISYFQKSKYFYLRNSLKLFLNEQIGNSVDTLHSSYTFGGHHAPICTELINEICFKSSVQNDKRIGTESLEEALRNLNVSTDAISNYGGKSLNVGTSLKASNLDSVIVCFVGGCTYAEITALRRLGLIKKWDILIFTSCILKTKDLIMQSRMAD